VLGHSLFGVDDVIPLPAGYPVKQAAIMNEEHQEGHYESKQLSSGIPLLSWSHRSRFALARRFVMRHAGGRLLDYGCGDGTFLARVSDLFPDATGAGSDAKEIEGCRHRFARNKLRFALTTDLATPEHHGAYDVVTCMEVLEHCVDAVIDAVLADLSSLVSPSGVVIISVPIEIGPSLIAKQIVRRVAGWRIYDYKFNERYSAWELLRMLAAREGTPFKREVYCSPTGKFHGHKGFNWRALRYRIRRTMTVERTAFSPLGLPGGFISSQAWFICKRFGADAASSTALDRQPEQR
jgi:2-polyprenyl-3-methyl-5-hydroxy-6-metoxy-1,4-benzoquinol methylase